MLNSSNHREDELNSMSDGRPCLGLFEITASAGLARYHMRLGLRSTGNEFRHKWFSCALSAG